MTYRGPFQPLLFCDSVIYSTDSRQKNDQDHTTTVDVRKKKKKSQ